MYSVKDTRQQKNRSLNTCNKHPFNTWHNKPIYKNNSFPILLI